MNLELTQIADISNETLQITGSKSEANRLLILQALYSKISIKNLSNSDDSQVMQEAIVSSEELVDIHHAGTAMRFLTSYFATREGRKTVLTGSERMQQRPIKILVDALRDLGADITYQNEEGYPPIVLNGKKLTKNKVSLKANVSSQYISSLMLIAPSLENGLEIALEGKVTSVPYIKMTLSLLKEIGAEGSFEHNVIKIAPLAVCNTDTIVVESDWSSASYFYSLVALSKNAKVTLGSYKKSSYQGDAALAEIYKNLGVQTSYNNNTITLEKVSDVTKGTDAFNGALDLANSPDIAQTIAVTCFGLGVSCHLTGLHTLKIKETDRLEALKAEIEKLGGIVEITEDALKLRAESTIKAGVAIATYQDHRMAMAFAPLALRTQLLINEAEVVSKSYPDFWSDMQKLGFQINEV
ncbi:3-phosphoshikimate 1-carboxyvinyltransferase [Aquimarina agarilytica]|uniref:3-phosphoshikimate 1-carboxyvinyltransferase n=1 Tax=Aquimarina agarilytica TaxID=1087449 RepID=UPI000287A856|nr:3-phosphoshikimate 1-carboxyvinyltransferase [Aquimarina agarilytica]